MQTKTIAEHKVYYYRLNYFDDLTDFNAPLLDIRLVEKPNIEFYRQLFDYLGSDWLWSSRKLLADEKLQETLHRDDNYLYVLYIDDKPEGMFEFSEVSKTEASLDFFGLHKSQHGQGLGIALLKQGHMIIKNRGYEEVILNTCEFDAPVARKIYEGIGYKLERTEIKPLTIVS